MHAMKAASGSEIITPHRSAVDGVSGQLYTLAALPLVPTE